MRLTQSAVKELLDYDPSTGIFTWRHRSVEWFSSIKEWRRWNGRYAGKRAGSVRNDRRNGYAYRTICVLHKEQKEHRLAWLYMAGDELPEEIDHRNRDASDNRWDNLKASSHLSNSRNKSKRVNNKSGISGVHWEKRRSRWSARGMLEGKRVHLGLYREIDEAAMAVLEFRADHGFSRAHGIEFAPYHTAATHGEGGGMTDKTPERPPDRRYVNTPRRPGA